MSAPDIFQRLISTLLKDHDNVVVLMDDILVYGASMEEQNKHLEVVLRTMTAFALKLNRAKCCFGNLKIQYFDHIISAGGKRPVSSKVNTITEIPSPGNTEELCQVLGLLNYLRKFLPGLTLW